MLTDVGSSLVAPPGGAWLSLARPAVVGRSVPARSQLGSTWLCSPTGCSQQCPLADGFLFSSVALRVGAMVSQNEVFPRQGLETFVAEVQRFPVHRLRGINYLGNLSIVPEMPLTPRTP